VEKLKPQQPFCGRYIQTRQKSNQG